VRLHLTSKGDRSKSRPFGLDVSLAESRLSEFDIHIVRRLSSMTGQYADRDSFAAMLEQDDEVVYEVYEIKRPEVEGEVSHGLSVVHPGTVGDEYFMTKGHFHAVLDTGEVYYCLAGRGAMVLQTPEDDWAVEAMESDRVVYVPPRWAHRSVNPGSGDLVMFFAYPGNAGHDYGTIERQGFRKLIVERDGEPVVIDNPRWRPAGQAGDGD
jgi:glucose-6-phosphate isomerase, archaeal